jgi:hypothetical protein
MLEKFSMDNVKEPVVNYDPVTRHYSYANPEEEGLPAYERCVEVPWTQHSIGQAIELIESEGLNIKRTKKLFSFGKNCRYTIFDFGCNKAKYLSQAKEKYDIKTFGLDLKKPAKNFVDQFYYGEFNEKLAKKVKKEALFDICTAISSIEHSGYRLKTQSLIDAYQDKIIKFLIDISTFTFLSVPFGKRPGWSNDGSRQNLFQFDESMINDIHSYVKDKKKNCLVEYYKFDAKHWSKVDVKEVTNSVYRDNKGGAAAIAFISICP